MILLYLLVSLSRQIKIHFKKHTIELTFTPVKKDMQ